METIKSHIDYQTFTEAALECLSEALIEVAAPEHFLDQDEFQNPPGSGESFAMGEIDHEAATATHGNIEIEASNQLYSRLVDGYTYLSIIYASNAHSESSPTITRAIELNDLLPQLTHRSILDYYTHLIGENETLINTIIELRSYWIYLLQEPSITTSDIVRLAPDGINHENLSESVIRGLAGLPLRDAQFWANVSNIQSLPDTSEITIPEPTGKGPISHFPKTGDMDIVELSKDEARDKFYTELDEFLCDMIRTDSHPWTQNSDNSEYIYTGVTQRIIENYWIEPIVANDEESFKKRKSIVSLHSFLRSMHRIATSTPRSESVSYPVKLEDVFDEYVKPLRKPQMKSDRKRVQNIVRHRYLDNLIGVHTDDTNAENSASALPYEGTITPSILVSSFNYYMQRQSDSVDQHLTEKHVRHIDFLPVEREFGEFIDNWLADTFGFSKASSIDPTL